MGQDQSIAAGIDAIHLRKRLRHLEDIAARAECRICNTEIMNARLKETIIYQQEQLDRLEVIVSDLQFLNSTPPSPSSARLKAQSVPPAT